MADFGTTSIEVLFILSAGAGALALVGVRRASGAMLLAARLLVYAAALIASLSILALTYAFAVSDFSITYVQHYSDRAMPLFYKLTGVWGGQEGSLLLWAWLLALMSALAVRGQAKRLPELTAYATFILMAILGFFCLLLLFVANPFDTFLSGVPQAGQGLNPLLQNAYMVTHPPALYLGYVGMAIPFAFAMASLLSGRSDACWVRVARPWTLASWYFLSLGLALGMLWAYEELGWGGYWAWDPVENAGLIPWLTSTAFLHSALLQERRQMFTLWNIVLALLSFELTIFGTFLTRSGFIQSVHAFAQSDLGYYFLGFMVLVPLCAVGLMLKHRHLFKGGREPESMLSREFLFTILIWVLLAATLLVIVLTIFPTLSPLLFGEKVSINAAAFNRWMIPLGLSVLLLEGACVILRWRSMLPARLGSRMLAPGLLSLALCIFLALFGVRAWLPLLTFALCAFVLSAILLDLHRARPGGPTAAPARDAGGPAAASAWDAGGPAAAPARFGAWTRRKGPRYAAYLAHAGMALMFVGFAGEAFKEEGEYSLTKGQRATLGSYELRFDGTRLEQDEQKEMAIAMLSVYRNGERLGTIQPARWLYFKHERQPTTEVDIARSWKEDLFVILGSVDANGERATFKVIINPLVNWIWIGFILLSLGAMLALVPWLVPWSRVHPG